MYGSIFLRSGFSLGASNYLKSDSIEGPTLSKNDCELPNTSLGKPFCSSGTQDDA